jgi:hypothetical protein
MRHYTIEVKNSDEPVFHERLPWAGVNPRGERIGFTASYMEKDGKPFFAVCGEFHFSRYDERFWKDEIIKLKMGGVNIVSTYIFWIHHEETAGSFDWSGNKNLRRFVEFCGELELYVMIRIGPFCHGEVRNGGLPDWLFGRPFAVRSNDPGYLVLVGRLYREIGLQVKGLFYQDGGPIIGVQLENEYRHAGAPWELTTATSNEWVPAGKDGEAHMCKLKQLAREAGIDPPFFTATAWGGAAVPVDEMLPLWGGYAFWPWIFYGEVTEHPATSEYLFRDYHNNRAMRCYNFEPEYPPESLPYACCEMGGGMTVFYQYRFELPPQSVSAMSVLKTAGGCNFVGYYMFHGGTNPRGKLNQYLNEHTTPKLSYDFQAAVGEFGQLREHYRRLKLLHYFYRDFAEDFCPMQTFLPRDTLATNPCDTATLRYAVRAKASSGFLFLNNYQDHLDMPVQQDLSLRIELEDETITLPGDGGLKLDKDVCCILPFNLNLTGIVLKYATAQLITRLECEEAVYYFFSAIEGMRGEYCFDNRNIHIDHVENGLIAKADGEIIVTIDPARQSLIELHTDEGRKVNLATLTMPQSLNFWKAKLWGRERVLLTGASLLVNADQVRLESTDSTVALGVFPPPEAELNGKGCEVSKPVREMLFSNYRLNFPVKPIVPEVRYINKSQAELLFANDAFDGCKQVLLKIDYSGDVGYAFIDGWLFHDNFNNGALWELGLIAERERLPEKGMYIYITPLKQGAFIKSDSAMAARCEVFATETAEIHGITAVPVYEATLTMNQPAPRSHSR